MTTTTELIQGRLTYVEAGRDHLKAINAYVSSLVSIALGYWSF